MMMCPTRWISTTALALALAACPEQAPDETTAAATTTDATTAAATAGSTSTDATTTGAVDESGPIEPPMPTIDVMDFSRCDGTERDPQCVVTDETCICGPQCQEFGPAGAPGRCPLGEFAALCPGSTSEDDPVPFVCIIACTVDTDCPDPEMVCRPCPEPFEYACQTLGYFFEGTELNAGPNMCTWPTA